MFELTSTDGYTFYLNHLISSIGVIISMTIFMWLQYKKHIDKCFHAIISALFVFLGLHLSWLLKFAWWIIPIIVLFIGICKEFKDLFDNKKKLFDWKDILADAYGILSVLWVYIFSFKL
jgi:hypothetical protein